LGVGCFRGHLGNKIRISPAKGAIQAAGRRFHDAQNHSSTRAFVLHATAPAPMTKPLISVATPSFRSSEWLKLCIASVADQEGVAFEHIVQDACSDDGTLDWLPQDSRVQAFVEKDAGMYDAINRAWRKSQGDIVCYLNCDEQFLPGTLQTVARYFAEHPDVDILFGDAIVIGPDGSYRFHRKMLTPQLAHTQTCHLATLSCAMFARRRVLDEHGIWFNTEFRNNGDAVWVIDLLKKGLKTAVLRQFLSVFTDTGSNMSTNATGAREQKIIQSKAPRWVQVLRPWWILAHRIRRYLNGIYSQEPFSYDIYTSASPTRRVHFEAKNPTYRWRLQPA